MRRQQTKPRTYRAAALIVALGRRFTVWGALLTLPVYASVWIPPAYFWPAGFVTLLIPAFLGLNSALFIFCLLRRSRRILIPLAVLLLGLRFIMASISIHPYGTKIPAANAGLKVISYNLQVLHGGHKQTADQVIAATRILKWLDTCGADVLCLQEYYDKPESRTFNSGERLKAGGYKFRYFSKSWEVANKGLVGMAIYSRYPLKNCSTLEKGIRGNNQLLKADVQSPQGWVRVYNIHLASLRIKEHEIENNNTQAEVKRNFLSVFAKIKRGFLLRGLQTNKLEESIADSPYPVIVCGDLNELPYGNTYFRLRNRLNNAFEKAGSGFGFTFKGKIPFLRIDNQFADKAFSITSFRVCKEAVWSDHYPVSASYKLE